MQASLLGQDPLMSPSPAPAVTPQVSVPVELPTWQLYPGVNSLMLPCRVGTTPNGGGIQGDTCKPATENLNIPWQRRLQSLATRVRGCESETGSMTAPSCISRAPGGGAVTGKDKPFASKVPMQGGVRSQRGWRKKAFSACPVWSC